MQGSNGFWRMRRRCETLALDDFAFGADEARAPDENEITIRTRYIALDPYLARAMRSWAGEVPEWADGTIHGRIVGEVISSRAPGYAVGDTVLAIGRWQAVQSLAAARAELGAIGGLGVLPLIRSVVFEPLEKPPTNQEKTNQR